MFADANTSEMFVTTLGWCRKNPADSKNKKSVSLAFNWYADYYSTDKNQARVGKKNFQTLCLKYLKCLLKSPTDEKSIY